MAPPRVEKALAAMATLLGASEGNMTTEAGQAYDLLRTACAAHGDTWRVDARQLAALSAHLGGPEPLVGITCMALAELAANDNYGSRAQAQVRRPHAARRPSASERAATGGGGRVAREAKRRVLWPSRALLAAYAYGCGSVAARVAGSPRCGPRSRPCSLRWRG